MRRKRGRAHKPMGSSLKTMEKTQYDMNLLLSHPDFLNFASEYGNLSFESLCHDFEMKQNEKYLCMHTRKIWQGKDGDFYTKIRGKDGKVRLRHAVTKEALNRLITAHYKEEAEHPTLMSVFEEWIEERIRFGEVELGTIDKAKSDFDRYIKGTPLEH